MTTKKRREGSDVYVFLRFASEGKRKGSEREREAGIRWGEDEGVFLRLTTDTLFETKGILSSYSYVPRDELRMDEREKIKIVVCAFVVEGV